MRPACPESPQLRMCRDEARTGTRGHDLAGIIIWLKAPFAIVTSISALPNKRRKSRPSRTDAQRRSQTNPPFQVTSPADQLELLRAPAAVLVDVDAAHRVDGEAVGLVEFAGVGSGAAKIAEDFATATLHDLNARVVLVDYEHQALLPVAREVDGDR